MPSGLIALLDDVAGIAKMAAPLPPARPAQRPPASSSTILP